MKLNVNINNKDYCLDIKPNERLVDTLRAAGMKSVKNGCSEGSCGSCAVMINGTPKNSCIMLSGQVEGAKILTVEGMGTPENPHVLQQSFVDSGSTQCGFCNPGSLMSALALLESNKTPTVDDIKEALDGNLCRCTGYVKRIDAVLDASKKLAKKTKKSTRSKK